LGFELTDLILIFVLYWLIRHHKFHKDPIATEGTDDAPRDENRQLIDSNGNDARPIENGRKYHQPALQAASQPNNADFDDMDNVRETVIDF
jgi:hypothetical protein